ncbi:SVM family protein ['Planchonia careya' phytoplasma]|nr:SVM family protein ['Planchonia careya' phytoplasma]MDO8030303.1 SVM family protein ['Planchonia careya' phytoplasma]
MMQLKINYIFFLPLCFSYLGLFLLINIHPVMAMENNNKNQQKEDYDLLDKAIDDLNEGIKYFNKKGSQINLNRIIKLISIKKRNNQKEDSSLSSKKIKK